MLHRAVWSCVALCAMPMPVVTAADKKFQPDPASVQRYEKGYRYPQAGWIVLHIEGEPYERGVQHGRLMAPEIAAHLRCLAAMQSSSAPTEAWRMTRTLCNALFQRRYHREFLEEMKGIADGANAAGARFDGRALDLTDIVAANSWAEIDTLDSALEATPTGLEGIRFPAQKPKAATKPKGEHCSAFAATGPATRDGKIVFGHITMFGLYPGNFYNVWLDVKPAKGNRVFMQSYPGGMQSGMDYYFNDKGLLVCETTIAQTRFDATGLTVASRIRQALQYADGIDRAVEILKEGNNGLYTNEWLLADTKTNEIAMFELGTGKSRLYRSSKKEWYGDTEGFYWGCNNTKDLQVRLETLASTDGRPASAVFRPSDRDRTWQRLYDAHKGKIDVEFGKLAFTTPPLAAYHSLDAKFTTTDLARDLKTWALFGPPLGKAWQPTFDERKKYAEVQPLVGNGWTVLHANPPGASNSSATPVVDLHDPEKSSLEKKSADHDPETVAAWHGTLLPRTDADIWLATAFASYERIVALEHALREKNDGNLNKSNQERLGLALFQHAANYGQGVRAGGEFSLAKTRTDSRSAGWHQVAESKGVFLLHALRNRIGSTKFDAMMDDFGRAHAGRRIGVEEFRAAAEKAAGGSLQPFFDAWLNGIGIPALRLDKIQTTQQKPGAPWSVGGEVMCASGSLGAVEVTVETVEGEKTTPVKSDGSFEIKLEKTPTRVVVDKYGCSSKAHVGCFSVLTFHDELEQTLIVYGTGLEANVNREAAEALQQAVRERKSNYTIAIKSDRDVTEDELKTHHVLLIGRPDNNVVVNKWRDAWPVAFGSRSFAVIGATYAHMESAVLAAAANPSNPRFSAVVIAGLGGSATLRAAPRLLGSIADVVVLPHGQPARSLVIPAKELTVELSNHNGKRQAGR